MDKKIFVTEMETDECGRIWCGGKTFTGIKILYPVVAKELENLQDRVAYILEPRVEMDEGSACDFGSLLYRICQSDANCVGVVRPGFLEQGLKGYSEIDKLHEFVEER